MSGSQDMHGRLTPFGGRMVELVVVGLIIVGLIAVMAVFIGRQRGDAQRMQCQQRMLHVALGLMEHDRVRTRLPGWAEQVDGQRVVSWSSRTLPFLGEMASIPLDPAAIAAGTAESDALVPTLLCPSDPRDPSGPQLSYAVNVGLRDAKWEDASGGGDALADSTVVERPSTGLVFNLAGPPEAERTVGRLRTARDGDGLGYTLLISENMQATTWPATGEADGGVAWVNLPEGASEPMRINAQLTEEGPLRWPRPSSHHPGGVVGVMASGEPRFVSQHIDWVVWVQHLTTNSQDAELPDGQPVRAEFRRPTPTD